MSTLVGKKNAVGDQEPVLKPTPTNDDQVARRRCDFDTMGEALDYAALSKKGMNFHDARGSLIRPYPFSELRADALKMASRLIARGMKPGDRLALIAETCPEFAALFFGAIYAGVWPVPLPLPTSFGGKEAYIDQLAIQLKSSDPSLIAYPKELSEFAEKAAAKNGVKAMAWDDLLLEDAPVIELPKAKKDDIAYLQYSSGSTRFPHGVIITHQALLSNLNAHGLGMNMRNNDRCISWLPWYHDMGLVGCMLSIIANQISTDYLKTNDFARRPLAWLDLITRNEGHSISYSPTFGYDICARRMSSQTKAADRFDLSRWRVAGNGADMIRPDVMQKFVDAFSEAGFNPNAFMPSYGLAEATLAVSLMPLNEGIRVEMVKESLLSGSQADENQPERYRSIVNCGKPVKDTTISIRNADGKDLPEREVGQVWVKGPGIMSGYFRDKESTDACMVDGWLDTGDMGYMSDGYIYIVGRAKDMILVNGCNYWPQDIEWAVEQLPGFKGGDIAAFAITTESGEEMPAVLVQCRMSDSEERKKLHAEINQKVRTMIGMPCMVALVPPRSLPRTSSGKLSRVKARNMYLTGAIKAYDLD
ncbi:AMP-dependent synthetase and ligase [Zymomonas mobilis subsp. mobilis ZM4 = ATCC 31821]|uniref:AMP-dependent synthetase and ligase n=1 Tax=Zymomonas mobilis subsp. mobilis (strain ATCC 31821 / ZM4 / CP4) TaxID=264203 RepID=Q5NPN2_ZYMMO|nr:fatty acyl-AMP ligase [Zymomonas mobilis]AAV89328.2 AMP-dependent synthetase and ligase [Zymomonas mobilis subsp. mobilis ZM4 = ATCC 31821]AVZ25649.1 AMP-dependent synthetase and ligase [Zymomonas mobilis subsp. mobilis]AVZ27540.1 AMP-dependent synthetase and ligase [Zymomonas mobilis subsp. mobilis]AVZ41986.1 AMP-dependent synthetase and ligase [Zymomonas mobilis subsp. mobilis ZM4 = ATCC 31821]UBQ08458.1 fatty acyl-AMP ligase [Zymomonas mobilis]